MWQQVGHSLKALVWMNEPPRFDPRALVRGRRTPRLRCSRFCRCRASTGCQFAIAASRRGRHRELAFAHTHNYPGRMSIHLMPFATAMTVVGLAAMLPVRLRTWQPGEGRSGPRRVEAPN